MSCNAPYAGSRRTSAATSSSWKTSEPIPTVSRGASNRCWPRPLRAAPCWSRGSGEKLRLGSEAGSDGEISRRARAAILSGDIPDEIVEAIRDAARQLGGARLAVRSSATIEDGPVGSLAGLFDTYLGVETIDELVD